MKRPVIAVASGGPLETIVDGETGFLCSSNGELMRDPSGDLCSSNGELMRDPSGDQFAFKTNDETLIESFSNAMMKFVTDKSLSREMGLLGHERVKKYFSFLYFSKFIAKCHHTNRIRRIIILFFLHFSKFHHRNRIINIKTVNIRYQMQ